VADICKGLSEGHRPYDCPGSVVAGHCAEHSVYEALQWLVVAGARGGAVG
jgi:hypothetical protein